MTKEELEKELDEADDRVGPIGRTGRRLDAFRLSREIAARSRAEGLMFPFLASQFRLMTNARYLLDPDACKDACLAALALLESTEAAAAFEPGYSERKYRRYQRWIMACSYDNLAEATALTDGYNSPGLHRCVTDGIDVCKRVGKPECITCFQEYAASVFRAADDLDMALFHARRIMVAAPDEDDSDLRFRGAMLTFELELLTGRMGAAFEAFRRAVRHGPDYHSERVMLLELAHGAQLLMALLDAGQVPAPGDAGEVDLEALVAAAPEPVDEEQNPEEAYDRELVEAAVLAIGGDLAGSEALLAPWDDRLRRDGLLALWFEVRVRRVALALARGDAPSAERLTPELERAAAGAEDHLTLRRLRTLGQLDGPARLLACLAPLRWGRPSESREENQGDLSSTGSGESPSDGTAAPSTPAEEEPAPHELRIRAYCDAVEASPEGDDLRHPARHLAWVRGEEDREDGAPAARLLAALAWLVDTGPADEELASEIWDWSRGAAAAAPDDGVALARAAEIGASLIDRDPPLLADRLSSEAVERLFERAMALAPDRAEPFGRAGLRYVRLGEPEKAERPLARATRLDRHVVSPVLSLAEIYQDSGRASDALELIDLSVRDGCEAPALLWEGGLLARTLGRDQLSLSYFDRYEELQPGTPWVGYYRAIALASLGRFEEVREACRSERERGDGNALGLLALEAQAAKALEDPSSLGEALSAMLAMPLHGISGMSPSGIMSSLARGLAAAEGSELASALRTRTIAAGLMPDDLVRAERKSGEIAEGLSFYEITLHQRLDAEGWRTFPARLEGQEDWTVLRASYGVLARTEEEARSRVLQFHVPAPGSEPRIVDVEDEGGDYQDHPGVTYQSYFRSAEPDA